MKKDKTYVIAKENTPVLRIVPPELYGGGIAYVEFSDPGARPIFSKVQEPIGVFMDWRDARKIGKVFISLSKKLSSKA